MRLFAVIMTVSAVALCWAMATLAGIVVLEYLDLGLKPVAACTAGGLLAGWIGRDIWGSK